MEKDLKGKMEIACWIANSLFMRNRVNGSSANMSFCHKDHIYITSSGTCFGSLDEDDFSELDFSGKLLNGRKPSKEFPLHQMLYQNTSKVQAVIHTHSFYSTIWSCLKHKNSNDIIPRYTPYLEMKIGKIGLIPYAPPGTKELFLAFAERVNLSDGYILANHGPIIAGKNLLEAFYGLEELEESAKIAWHLKDKDSGGRLIADEW